MVWVQTREGALDDPASRIRAVFAQPFQVEGEPVLLEASVGASVYPRHGADAETLLRRAHLAMRAAKRDDMNFMVYRPEADEPSITNVQLLRDLRDALARNALELYYQPKIETATGAVTGCEALVRWPRDGGVLLPAQFVPLCERTGLMHRLDRWVLAAAARQFAAWDSEGVRVPLSVNVSARSFDEDRLPDAVFAAMDLWGISGRELELEVTETAMMANPSRATRVARRLGEMGVSVAVDDFGSGNCPFVYLRDFHAGSIKLANTFVQGIASDPACAAIVQTMIDLGRRLGLGVVAEGAEDQATVDHLRAMGCPQVQGFQIAEPMPASEVVPWLRREGRPVLAPIRE